ncbi:hypothetical protein PV333_37420 [Streptomyces sp. NY05-11A]|nr:hypothetical protein [Streptomyces sp. NY05-11A]
MRKAGALSLGQGIWAVPDVPVFADGIARAIALTERAGGQTVSLNASGRSAEDAARFRVLFDCAAPCEDYAERVFAAPHRPPAPHRTSEGQQ